MKGGMVRPGFNLGVGNFVKHCLHSKYVSERGGGESGSDFKCLLIDLASNQGYISVMLSHSN